MVVGEAPRPQPVLPIRVVAPTVDEPDLPQGLVAALSAGHREIRRKVLEPLLGAPDLIREFKRVWPTYDALVSAGSYALIAFLGLPKAIDLGVGAMRRNKALLEDQRDQLPPDPQATRVILASLETVDLVQRGLTNFAQKGKLDHPKASDLVMTATNWLVAHALCLQAVQRFCAEPKDSWRNNANALCGWAFQYAEAAAIHCGSAEIELGMYQPVR